MAFTQVRYVYPRKKTPFQKTTLKIGQVSKKTGIPIVTLRFYQTNHLIRPIRHGDGKKSGHRRFSPAVFVDLEFVKLCRESGFSIPETRSMMKLYRSCKTPTRSRMSAMVRTLEVVSGRIKGLMEIERVFRLRLEDPEADIENLLKDDERFWVLRGAR